ncbi:type I-C CRISPR-associated protein Cas5c [Acrocarpospora catenulata]|uniref:type I-C CRISPR-associated protein Cas5c n=1 Tax=Acrocarpospora catenulata TaxID=2836182 RepID=UPI001BD9C484|nr:type I-C CRISPR-associated protein Cas5c [Acrocarpospora catenulata]
MTHAFPLPCLERSSGNAPPVVVQVRADAALFSRPELKAERVTYPVMTPPAARGVLEAIFWKPQMRYRVAAIEVLTPIQQFTVRRNETHRVVPLDAALRGERVDTAAHRDQRNAVCLREVAYRIHAHIEALPGAKHNAAGYRDQFRRRVSRGACFHQPFLGTKEFSAEFGNPDDTPPITTSQDLGLMIHTIHHGPPVTMDWFTARLDAGVLYVPEHGIPASLETIGAR